METQEKKQIKVYLQKYIARYSSQNKAANSLKGVSSATISQVLNDKWELISDEMWRNLSSQLSDFKTDWQLVETRLFKGIQNVFKEAQSHSQVFALVDEAGSGKTQTAKVYAQSQRNVHLLACSEYWNRKYFLIELLSVIGGDPSGLTVSELVNKAVHTIKKEQKPLIIFDEADKLSDQVLYFFITLYNQLEDHCGIVLLATDHLEKRIQKGIKLNKKGYKEIFSRIGRRFVCLDGVNPTDITQICLANGIEDKQEIRNIYNDSEGDLRRVKRKIFAFKQRETNV